MSSSVKISNLPRPHSIELDSYFKAYTLRSEDSRQGNISDPVILRLRQNLVIQTSFI